MVARFGIESMLEMQDPENNPQDYGIARDKVRDVGFPCLKLGIRDLKHNEGKFRD